VPVTDNPDAQCPSRQYRTICLIFPSSAPGSLRLLLHVYRRPIRACSFSSSSFRKSLNIRISLLFNLALLLSAASKIKLKSPATAQQPGNAARTARSSSRNCALSASWVLPVENTAGGIIVAWKSDRVQVLRSHVDPFLSR
jgi:hypothetical protein